MLLGELREVAITGHTQNLDTLFFQGICKRADPQAGGIFRAEVFVNDYDRKAKLHGPDPRDRKLKRRDSRAKPVKQEDFARPVARSVAGMQLGGLALRNLEC